MPCVGCMCPRLLLLAVVFSGGERVGAGAPPAVADRYRPRDWAGGAGEQGFCDRIPASDSVVSQILLFVPSFNLVVLLLHRICGLRCSCASKTCNSNF